MSLYWLTGTAAAGLRRRLVGHRGGAVNRAVPETTLDEGQTVRLRTLPSAKMACIVHNGPYEALDCEHDRMLAWLERTGCRPAGPLREVYLRFGADPSLRLPQTHVVDDTDPEYVTELQLPVSPPLP
jgi:effector-binding domain-containing protein